jgi:hypothetical protein
MYFTYHIHRPRASFIVITITATITSGITSDITTATGTPRFSIFAGISSGLRRDTVELVTFAAALWLSRYDPAAVLLRSRPDHSKGDLVPSTRHWKTSGALTMTPDALAGTLSIPIQ